MKRSCQILALLLLGNAACGGGDPNAVLAPTFSDYEFAGHIAGFDSELRPIATAGNVGDPTRMIRINADLTATNLSDGIPATLISSFVSAPNGYMYIRTENQLWQRGATDSMWTQVTTPVGTRTVNEAVLFSFVVDATGNAWVVIFEHIQPTDPFIQRIYQRPAGTATWQVLLERPLANGGDDPFEISAREDGTLFVAQAGMPTVVYAPGATTSQPLMTCRTDIIDQTCEVARMSPVKATPFSNRAYVGLSSYNGTFAHPPFYVVEGSGAELVTRQVTPPSQNGGVVEMMVTGDLFYYFVQSEPVDEPPYSIDRSVLFRANASASSFTRVGKIDGYVEAAEPGRLYRINSQLLGTQALPGKIIAWDW